MTYQPIENYGIIGNMYTTALVGINGSIDWFCFPRHDSPSVFAALLDRHKGGHFQIHPTTDAPITHKQFYWPETNILVTRFLAPCGVGEIIDFMPVGKTVRDRGYRWLVRQVKAIRGSMKFRMECYPAFDYARKLPKVQLTASGARLTSPDLSLGLATYTPLQGCDRGVFAEFTLEADEQAVFVLQETGDDFTCTLPLSRTKAQDLFEETVVYWRNWLSQCTYRGRWQETVERSALVLKLLTYEPTGAIIAAPTCSLPEEMGGSRNWDYRYTWIRDAAFTLYALLRIGFTQEAAQFMNWIESRCQKQPGDDLLHVVYSVDGCYTLYEEILHHLEGYRKSAPVRIGNEAANQLQLDIYGELMDSVYLFNKYGALISHDLWTHLRRMIDWLCDNWDQEDEGIWETRGGRKHFLYSKLMVWVAFDRALRLSEKRSFPADRLRWLKVRDRVYEEIMTRGWNDTRQAFVQSYDSEALDAGALIMPMIFFMAPNDPRMLKTLNAIAKTPKQGGLVSNSLVYRYNLAYSDDGLSGQEGTFNLCTFWLVEALTRAGRVDRTQLNRARLIFEEMLSYANHLGLYAEETGASGEALGNFPQAFTHLSLISAAWNLNRAIEDR
ncbi:MAG: glycoside hydrolase family 15 protein [Limnospira sp.]